MGVSSSMTTHLPFEILTAIFEQFDDVTDLRNLRTVSRTFCAVASPLAFRALSVTNTKEGAQNLGRLFDVAEIAAHVREVLLRLRRIPDSEEIDLSPIAGDRVRTNAIPELASSFSRIHQLFQLEIINLTSPLRFETGGILARHASILDALADSFSIRAPSKLTSLFLKNLRTCDLTSLESSSFQAVLKNLRRLQLYTNHDRSEGIITSSDESDPCLPFWGTHFHRVVLNPTQHTLTELTLECNQLVSALSGLSFAGLHFPYLCALSLRNIVFEPSVGVESFILRHAATLARLELVTCMLPLNFNTGSSARPIHWAHIWDSFAVELTALVALHVNVTSTSGLKLRYVLTGPKRRTNAPEDVDAADGAALRQLYATVATRSKEARNTS